MRSKTKYHLFRPRAAVIVSETNRINVNLNPESFYPVKLQKQIKIPDEISSFQLSAWK